MPRIPDVVLDCVVYLYEDEGTARKARSPGGSGLLVAYDSPGKTSASHGYVVTCQHIVDQGFLTVRLNCDDGQTADFHTSQPTEWFHSPQNDLAVLPLAFNDKHNIGYISPETFVSKLRINDLGIGIGDDVFLVGRLIDHAGNQRNTPSVRFGNIAMMPNEPIQNSHLGKPVEAFLCEVKSIGGFSGSPVFVHILPFSMRWRTSSTGETELARSLQPRMEGPYLLGIDWGHMIGAKEPVRDKNDDKLDMYVQRNSGITCVAPAWHLLELLESPGPCELRREQDDALQKPIAE